MQIDVTVVLRHAFNLPQNLKHWSIILQTLEQNGSEFISKALDKWAYERGVVLDFSRPGKSTDNAFIIIGVAVWCRLRI